MHSKPSRIAAAAILALGCAMPAASRAVAIDRGASPPADAVAIPKGSREKAVKELPHIIDRVMRRSRVPGMAGAVVLDARTVFARGYGTSAAAPPVSWAALPVLPLPAHPNSRPAPG